MANSIGIVASAHATSTAPHRATAIAAGEATNRAAYGKPTMMTPAASTAQSSAPTCGYSSITGRPLVGALPQYPMEKTELSRDTVAQVNLSSGNLLITAKDGSISGPGESIDATRWYNSRQPLCQGGFANRWHSTLGQYDSTLIRVTNTAYFVGNNGFEAGFSLANGIWSARPGFNATLTEDSSSTNARYKVRYNKTGETYTFNNLGYITRHADRNNVGVSLAASGQYYYIHTADSGRSIKFEERPGRGAIAYDTVTNNRAWQYLDNADGDLVTVQDPSGTATYTYDADHQLASMRLPGATSSNDLIVSFTYDSNGRVLSMKRSAAGDTSDAASRITTYSYSSDPILSTATTVTDPRGHAASYKFDSQGRMTSATDALGHTKAQTWTANSDVQTSTDAFGSGSTPGNTTTRSYDSLSNPTSVKLPSGAMASASYAQGSGCNGTTGDAYQARCITDDSGNTQMLTYDAAGNQTRQTNTSGGGSTTNFQLSYENQARTVCGGFAGQVCTATDGRGNTTKYSYNSAGDLTSIAPPAPQGATTYGYDALGRVTTIKKASGNTTAYTYNQSDQVTKASYTGGRTVATSYATGGLVSKVVDSTAGTKSTTYDAFGFKTGSTGPGSVSESYSYDKSGNILTFVDTAKTTTYSYDSANRLTQVQTNGGTCVAGTAPAAGSGCVQLSYDANDAETMRKTPGNATVTTTRDVDGRPTRITAKNASGAAVYDVGYSYSAPGVSGATSDRTNIQTRTSYAEVGVPAGAVNAYTYDSSNRLLSSTEKVASTVNASWAYSYDAAGNRTQQTLTGNTGMTAGVTSYSYDAADRLTSTSRDTTTWTYDADGNQTRNGLTGVTSAYDSLGSTTGIGAAAFTTFGEGNGTQLTRATPSASYVNTSLGLTTETVAAGTRSILRSPTQAALGTTLENGQQYFFITDALGSVVGLIDSSGAWAGGYSYSPYGTLRSNPATGSPADKNSIRYIAGYFDQSSGLYKLGARFYDPSLGRFTQIDPSGQEANPYNYGKCNPINASDPSGLLSQHCSDLAVDVLLDAGEATLATVATVALVETVVGSILSGAAALLTITKLLVDYNRFLRDCT